MVDMFMAPAPPVKPTAPGCPPLRQIARFLPHVVLPPRHSPYRWTSSSFCATNSCPRSDNYKCTNSLEIQGLQAL